MREHAGKKVSSACSAMDFHGWTRQLLLYFSVWNFSCFGGRKEFINLWCPNPRGGRYQESAKIYRCFPREFKVPVIGFYRT